MKNIWRKLFPVRIEYRESSGGERVINAVAHEAFLYIINSRGKVMRLRHDHTREQVMVETVLHIGLQ